MSVKKSFNAKKQFSNISGRISDENDFEEQSGESGKYYPDLYAEDWLAGEDYYIGIGSWSGESAPSEVLSENSLKVLNFLESGCMISVLEDVYEELEILKYVIGAPVVGWKFEYETLEERFVKRPSVGRIFPEVDSIPAMTNPLKLQRDRTFVADAIKNTMKTLMDDGTFDPLLYAGRQLFQRHKDETELMEEYQRNMDYLNDIKERVRKKKKLEDDEEKERDGLLYMLKDGIDDATLKCEVEEKFVDKWEITRNKQNQWRLKEAEDFYRKNLDVLKVKTELEHRATNEMQTYIRNAQMILEEELEEWMARYDAELERREMKIIQLKYERDQQEEEAKRLNQLYEDRIVEMREWVAFRDVRKERTAASVIIQSWWRGLMVRKKLGPYKVKKPHSEEGKRKK